MLRRELLEGLSFGEDAFDEWLADQRARLRRLLCDRLMRRPPRGLRPARWVTPSSWLSACSPSTLRVRRGTASSSSSMGEAAAARQPSGSMKSVSRRCDVTSGPIRTRKPSGSTNRSYTPDLTRIRNAAGGRCRGLGRHPLAFGSAVCRRTAVQELRVQRRDRRGLFRHRDCRGHHDGAVPVRVAPRDLTDSPPTRSEGRIRRLAGSAASSACATSSGTVRRRGEQVRLGGASRGLTDRAARSGRSSTTATSARSSGSRTRSSRRWSQRWSVVSRPIAGARATKSAPKASRRTIAFCGGRITTTDSRSRTTPAPIEMFERAVVLDPDLRDGIRVAGLRALSANVLRAGPNVVRPLLRAGPESLLSRRWRERNPSHPRRFPSRVARVRQGRVPPRTRPDAQSERRSNRVSDGRAGHIPGSAGCGRAEDSARHASNPYFHARYWLRLAQALYHQGRFEEALEALDREPIPVPQPADIPGGVSGSSRPRRSARARSSGHSRRPRKR